MLYYVHINITFLVHKNVAQIDNSLGDQIKLLYKHSSKIHSIKINSEQRHCKTVKKGVHFESLTKNIDRKKDQIKYLTTEISFACQHGQ